MSKVIYLAFLTLVASIPAFAAQNVPEIDPASGAAAITMLSGAVLVVRSRRRK